MKRCLFLFLPLVLILTEGFGNLFRSDPFEKPPDAASRPAEQSRPAGERLLSFIISQAASTDWLRAAEPPDLVPPDALLVVDMADAAAAAKAFASSPLGTAFASANWIDSLDFFELSKAFRQPLTEGAAALATLAAHPLTQAIFSRRAAVALLNPEAPPQDGGAEFWLEHLLVIAQQDKDSRPDISLLRPARQQTVYHQGIAVQRLELQGGSKAYAASVGGLFLLSPGLRSVQAGIEQFLLRFVRRQTGMPLNPNYAAIKASAQQKDDFFLHTDLSRLAALLNLPAPPFQSLGLFHQRENKIDRFTAAFRFLPERPAAWAEVPPTESRSAAKMPADLLLYFWSSWLHPGLCRQAVLASEDETAADAWLRQKGGLGLEEVAALFGREFSLSIAGISTSGTLPVPRISVTAEVREQDKAERFLRRLISGLPVRREAAAGVPVVSLLAGNGLMQPSYAFADGLLLLADSREQIEDILSDSPPKLVRSPVFQAAAGGWAGQPANLSLFIRPAEMADGVKELAVWAGAMLALQDEKKGKKSKMLIDQTILPLLDGFKMFEAAALRSVVQPGELLFEAALCRQP